jgi:DNA-binding NtrC family response regulator
MVDVDEKKMCHDKGHRISVITGKVMKGTVFVVGSEDETLEKCSTNLTGYGFKVEPFTTFESCLNDILQGSSPDVLLIKHEPPAVDALIYGQQLTDEHKLSIPMVMLAAEELRPESSRLASAQGIFAIHFGPIIAQQVANSVTQAAVQKQLLNIAQNLLNENQKLLGNFEILVHASELMDQLKDPDASSEDTDSMLQAFRQKIRGRDFHQELDKARRFLSQRQDEVAHATRTSFKT